MSDSTPALLQALKKSIEDFVTSVVDKLKGYATTQALTEGLSSKPSTQAVNTAISDATKDLATKQALTDGLSSRPTNAQMQQAIQSGIGSRPTSEQITMFVVADHAPTQAEINNLPDGAVWFQTGA